jgi:hypothetical protein
MNIAKVKVKFTEEQAMKSQRRNRGIALFFRGCGTLLQMQALYAIKLLYSGQSFVLFICGNMMHCRMCIMLFTV